MRAEPHPDLGLGFGHGVWVEVLVVLVVSLGVADAAAVDPRRVVWAPKLAVGSAITAQDAWHFCS
uniref:Uncharacterized protein n=1 Tax=viral metagenome TaxID=1070528 RepID=A0A6C0F8L6_9ZZZZ